MPPAHRGPTGSPMDRWTDASPTAISSGFQTAMSLGPQPRLNFDMPASSLSQSMTANNFNTDDDDDDDDDDEDADLGSPANTTTTTTAAAKKPNGKGARAKKNGAAGAAAAKGKDARAAQHRKEQNRAAQREFRQRKQQYIRALEARVELLSSDHDTQVNRLRFALRHLLAENNTLRGIVGSLAHFIGKRSIGGCLVESGMSREMLESTMNSTSEKVMSEAWVNWPGAGECEALKQIRKESNIPAEGLPESKLIGHIRDANAKGAAPESASSAAPDATASAKKKRNADDAPAKDSKRKRKTDETLSAAAPGSNTTGTSPDESTSSMPANAPAAGHAFNPSVPNAANWPQQQPQQQQPPYALPTQFWQPSPVGLGRQFRNDVDSTFAQTLLGGGNADLSSLASLFPSEAAMNPSLFSPSEPTAFNGLVRPSSANDGGSRVPDPNSASHLSFLGAAGFAPSTPNYGHAMGAEGAQHAFAILMPSTASGGVETVLLPSSARMTPEHQRALRRRTARALAQVNRLWAKRGATYFLNLPPDYQLDDDDVRYIEQQEASNPHIKLASVRLPNGWDEGDLGGGGKARSDGSDAASMYDTESKVDNFIRLSYHIHNQRMNPNYTLPSILKPTPLQLSTPHDRALDPLPWPALRDKLIQMPNLETHSLIIDLIRFSSPGDGDVHSEKNWVLTLPFFIRYPQLADETLLANTNAQRKARGEPEVTMDEVWKQHQMFQEYTQAKLKEL
ncbi:uncharacterized protein SRS1_12914 [Sporisorium reilianum f. sp. reilianum]|uniref:BZIP domain-containing protein n=1 Tax=Sporisorium reilianum f. sp. reilianum TaxID=72559 RepID=A0A2N8UAV7_9BASI|nr:uncharacterized protein SRS1_12914 [Sporisorium reilianum f. sp. reilianum]